MQLLRVIAEQSFFRTNPELLAGPASVHPRFGRLWIRLHSPSTGRHARRGWPFGRQGIVPLRLSGLIDLVRIRNTHGYTGKIVALPCDGSPDCLRATLHRWEERSPMMAFDSQGIALILLVAVLSLVVGGAALWIELR